MEVDGAAGGKRDQKKPRLSMAAESQRRQAGTSSKGVQAAPEYLGDPALFMSAATQTASGGQVEVGTSMAERQSGQQDAGVQTEEERRWKKVAPGNEPEVPPHAQVGEPAPELLPVLGSGTGTVH